MYYRVFSSDFGLDLPDAGMSRDIAKYIPNHNVILSALFPTGVDPKSIPNKHPVQKPLDSWHNLMNGSLNKYKYVFIAKLYPYYRNYIMYSIKTKNNLRQDKKKHNEWFSHFLYFPKQCLLAPPRDLQLAFQNRALGAGRK